MGNSTDHDCTEAPPGADWQPSWALKLRWAFRYFLRRCYRRIRRHVYRCPLCNRFVVRWRSDLFWCSEECRLELLKELKVMRKAFHELFQKAPNHDQ